jgi:hypothetical protein
MRKSNSTQRQILLNLRIQSNMSTIIQIKEKLTETIYHNMNQTIQENTPIE